MEQYTQEWFELRDHRSRLFSRAVWVPVYGSRMLLERKRFPEIGHVEEVLAVGSAVVFNDMRDKAEELDWHRLSLDETQPYLGADDQYFESEGFYDVPDKRLGIRLVLTQYLNSAHPRQVFINQDFILAYGLLEEGDKWLRPNEGYEEVIRLTRKDDGAAGLVEFRAEYLKDYLAARGAALRLYYYRQRRAILPANPGFNWPDDCSLVSEKHDRLEGRCSPLNASGDFHGTTWAVFKSWRTDIDPEEEVPDFSGPDDGATESESTRGIRGDNCDRFLVTGEMWRGEWIEPANNSFRIGYGEPEEALMVQLDGGGEKVDLATLDYEEIGKYLWFKPTLINDLLSRRGSTLEWYTFDTGGVSASPDWLLHFGVNKLGLINAYAYDVARRPLWERRIWAAHNCRPDGGVSAELLRAQMECKPVSTKAPEVSLKRALDWIELVFQEKFNKPLFREHDEIRELSPKVHRFRAMDESGLRSLAKDLVKISIEPMSKGSLIAALGISKSEQGTLKLLQQLLARYTDDDYAYTRMTPLFGAYDLRASDAHLSSSNVEECYERVGVDRSAHPTKQAEWLIQSVAGTFGMIGNEFKRHVPDNET